ncbi:hypothetical protein FOCC_FOCC011542 [Frankliniella occidentalis]|uniref:DNA repair endonuclease XPF n=1 Tax=Frankliniella occidentalis TaxID=133901 RepID=A0A6J1SBI5_FRAOC|nr:DNA repair endonuclease XPF [Frankliniella occidentalis]KAE8742861.1 hypothetical protein FOCC_FOCC011542 [Frankliniella occidentalis]
MLPYENQIFLDVLHEDGLVVAARGLSLHSVILSLLKVWCDSGNLVLVLGTHAQEEEYFITELEAQGIKPLPKIINNESNANDRENIYLQGGVLFVSARILVVDLLKNRVPVDNVTGMMVCRAHAILESCQEAFAVRLYRQKNKKGFVKAFSSSAQSFTVGFAQVERIMKTLFVKNLYLWPRFHAVVSTSLRKVSVVELHVNMTTPMQRLQNCVLDLMSFCVKEIKRVNPSLDTDDLTVENAISKSFHKLLQYQLDPIWNQLSSKTRQLVADIKTLRSVLRCLTQYDCVTFNSLVTSLRSTEYARRNSGWLLLDPAEDLFLLASQRVCGSNSASKDSEINPEHAPKWVALSEILGEVQEKLKGVPSNDAAQGINHVLVLVEDIRTGNQLKEYLTKGSKAMLQSLFRRATHHRTPAVIAQFGLAKDSSVLKRKSLDPDDPDNWLGEDEVEAFNHDSFGFPQDDTEEDIKDSYCLTMTQQEPSKSSNDPANMSCFEEQENLESLSQSQSDQLLPIITIQSFKKDGDPLALTKTLQQIQPHTVVMYDADLSAVRQLEVFQSSSPSVDLTTYFVMYGGSVEEQAYLTTLRQEKEAFEYLIKEKASMVIPADQDGKSGDCAELRRDVGQSASVAAGLPNINTRKGGIPKAPASAPTIIVDMREFRSELPALIHRRGIEIEPVTINVGDYILTPEICVERKSVSDLIGSLNNGRLYTQATAMSRHYSKPMLLIEFDHKKPFALQGRYYLSNDISASDISSKLILLTMHFPRLRLVWSPSPYATAQLFEELKEGREQPNASQAAMIGAEVASGDDEFAEKFNIAIQDFISKLPGVNTKNVSSVLRKGQSLSHLISLSKEQLSELTLNSQDADLLYSALHNVHKPVEDGSGKPMRGGKGGRWRGRSFLKRKKQ